jgi:hypothetical protein
VARRPARSDREIFNDELDIARIADATGFDEVWTIESGELAGVGVASDTLTVLFHIRHLGSTFTH